MTSFFPSISKNPYAQPIALSLAALAGSLAIYSYLKTPQDQNRSERSLHGRTQAIPSPGLFTRFLSILSYPFLGFKSIQSPNQETPPPPSLPPNRPTTTQNSQAPDVDEEEFIFPFSTSDSIDSPLPLQNSSRATSRYPSLRGSDENEIDSPLPSTIPSRESEDTDYDFLDESEFTMRENPIRFSRTIDTEVETRYFDIPETLLSQDAKEQLHSNLELHVQNILLERKKRSERALGLNISTWTPQALSNSVQSTFTEAPFKLFLNTNCPRDLFTFETRTNTYQEKLDTLRDTLRIFPNREDLLQSSYNIYNRRLLREAEVIMREVLQPRIEGSLSAQLNKDINDVDTYRKTNKKLCDSSWGRKAGKFSGAVNLMFDSHKNNNLPFSIATLSINKRAERSTVTMLRFPAPIISTAISMYIAPEFSAFLTRCKEKNEKLLYNCLFNPHDITEGPRLTLLKNQETPFPKTFYFIRFPLDGPLHSTENFQSLAHYIDEIRLAVQNGIHDSDSDFIFSSNTKEIVRAHYEKILDLAGTVLQAAYEPEELLENENEAKKAFMMLFCTMLKEKIISDLQINYSNDTCKDAIDRGGAHMVSALLWRSFLTKTLANTKTREFIRLAMSFPSWIAKTQPIIKKGRADWITSLSNALDNIEKKGRTDEVIARYARTMEVTFDSLDFHI